MFPFIPHTFLLFWGRWGRIVHLSTPTPRAIGWAMKCYRTRPDTELGQIALAERSRLTCQRIANIESGRVTPTEDELKAIGKVLRIKPADLLALAKSGKPIVRQPND